MNEERINMPQVDSVYKNKHKKSANHSDNKDQQIWLSEQLIEKSMAYSEMVSRSTNIGDAIPNVSAIFKLGRRVMDQTNLENQIREEDEKARSLCRQNLTPERVQDMGQRIILKNDATYFSKTFLIIWHTRVPKILVKKFWNFPTTKLNAALHLENRAFQHLHITDIDGIKTKKSGMAVINKHIDFVNDYGKNILTFVDDLGGFDHKDVYKSDVLSFFVHPIPEAFGRDIAMEQVEEALVKRCSVLDLHYTYTAPSQDDSDDEINDYMEFDDIENEMVSLPDNHEW